MQAQPSLKKLHFEPGEYYLQCAATKYFLALRGKHLLLDDTQKLVPTFTGLVTFVQNQDGSTTLYSSLNDALLKVDGDGEIVTITQEEKEFAGNDFEDFELIQTSGNDGVQLIIRSIQTQKFVRVSEFKSLRADVTDPIYASKFVLKPRYLFKLYIKNHYLHLHP